MLLITLFLYGMAAAAVAPRDCNHDNCLRAVIASAYPTRMGAADCLSYFQTTVTPATSTSTSIACNPMQKRRDREPAIVARQATVVPTSIPAYASACSGSARYSSACSCIGVTAATTTAPTPKTTVTVTPALSVTEYSSTFNCQATDEDDTFVSPLNECVVIEDSSIMLGALTPSDFSASNCAVNFYLDFSCTELYSTREAGSMQCFKAVAFLSMMLLCSCPA